MKRSKITFGLAIVQAVALGACNGILLVDDEQDQVVWQGNAPDCPASAPASGDPCSVAEGQLCRFVDPSDTGGVLQSIYGCWEAGGGTLRWEKVGDGISGPDHCPASEPANGDTCFGHYGAWCIYPERTSCECGADGGKWVCEENQRDDIPSPPSAVNPDKPINTLTDAERTAWCSWYFDARNGPGFPQFGADIDENGYASTGCSLETELMCGVVVPALPTDLCAANLALSQCDAPISELTDCIATVYDSCFPLDHGCARYRDRPNCHGTMVIPYEPAPAGSAHHLPDCSVRVQ